MNIVGFTGTTEEVGDGQLIDNVLRSNANALQHSGGGGSSSSSSSKHVQTPHATHPMHSARTLEDVTHVTGPSGVVHKRRSARKVDCQRVTCHVTSRDIT